MHKFRKEKGGGIAHYGKRGTAEKGSSATKTFLMCFSNKISPKFLRGGRNSIMQGQERISPSLDPA